MDRRTRRGAGRRHDRRRRNRRRGRCSNERCSAVRDRGRSAGARDRITDMKRLAIVASHVIQYQDPFFRLLAQEPDIDLTVIYCSNAGAVTYRDEDMKTTLRWDIDLLQGYRHVTLRNFGLGDGYTRLINPGIVPAIVRGRYDAVIFMLGWGSISALLGIAACRMTQTPFFLYGDSSFPPPETTLRAKLRARFIRGVFS